MKMRQTTRPITDYRHDERFAALLRQEQAISNEALLDKREKARRAVFEAEARVGDVLARHIIGNATDIELAEARKARSEARERREHVEEHIKIVVAHRKVIRKQRDALVKTLRRQYALDAMRDVEPLIARSATLLRELADISDRVRERIDGLDGISYHRFPLMPALTLRGTDSQTVRFLKHAEEFDAETFILGWFGPEVTK